MWLNLFLKGLIMGLLGTIKGWLNIGGVKVKLEGLNQIIAKDGNLISAKVRLTSKSEKQVLKMVYKFLLERTTGRGDEKKTKEFLIAERVLPEGFTMQAGEEKVVDFSLNYSLDKSLKDMGGMLGGLGKMAAMATAEKDEYFVIAEVDVKGTALDPSDKVAVTIK
jgi:sporulation-control protein spo0M